MKISQKLLPITSVTPTLSLSPSPPPRYHVIFVLHKGFRGFTNWFRHFCRVTNDDDDGERSTWTPIIGIVITTKIGLAIKSRDARTAAVGRRRHYRRNGRKKFDDDDARVVYLDVRRGDGITADGTRRHTLAE